MDTEGYYLKYSCKGKMESGQQHNYNVIEI